MREKKREKKRKVNTNHHQGRMEEAFCAAKTNKSKETMTKNEDNMFVALWRDKNGNIVDVSVNTYEADVPMGICLE